MDMPGLLTAPVTGGTPAKRTGKQPEGAESKSGTSFAEILESESANTGSQESPVPSQAVATEEKEVSAAGNPEAGQPVDEYPAAETTDVTTSGQVPPAIQIVVQESTQVTPVLPASEGQPSTVTVDTVEPSSSGPAISPETPGGASEPASSRTLPEPRMTPNGKQDPTISTQAPPHTAPAPEENNQRTNQAPQGPGNSEAGSPAVTAQPAGGEHTGVKSERSRVATEAAPLKSPETRNEPIIAGKQGTETRPSEGSARTRVDATESGSTNPKKTDELKSPSVVPGKPSTATRAETNQPTPGPSQEANIQPADEATSSGRESSSNRNGITAHVPTDPGTKAEKTGAVSTKTVPADPEPPQAEKTAAGADLVERTENRPGMPAVDVKSMSERTGTGSLDPEAHPVEVTTSEMAQPTAFSNDPKPLSDAASENPQAEAANVKDRTSFGEPVKKAESRVKAAPGENVKETVEQGQVSPSPETKNGPMVEPPASPKNLPDPSGSEAVPNVELTPVTIDRPVAEKNNIEVSGEPVETSEETSTDQIEASDLSQTDGEPNGAMHESRGTQDSSHDSRHSKGHSNPQKKESDLPAGHPQAVLNETASAAHTAAKGSPESPEMEIKTGKVKTADTEKPAEMFTEPGAQVSTESRRFARLIQELESASPLKNRFPVDWIRNVSTGSLRLESLENGWKALDIQLPDGNGTVTVRARREEDRISVSVGFSDPGLRTFAAANTDRLKEILQDQYGTQVDFSLMKDNAEQQQKQAQQQTQGKTVGHHRNSVETVLSGETKSTTTRHRSTHEWVG